jgi:hypothetical protein
LRVREIDVTWPGEALLIKLWETLAEKGVGRLLSPWQIKREATAHAQARALELVMLADAKREAAEIRSGRRRLADSRYALALPAPGQEQSREAEIKEGAIRPAVEVSTSTIVGDALRREVNVAQAITHAEAELQNDSQQPSDRDVEADWLYRWRDYAGDVSSEQLQSLWGRLLAGEVKSPGSYSYRTLEFVRNLSGDEARRIERLSRFVITDFIARNQKQILAEEGVTFGELLYMQDLGVISGVESIGLSLTLRSNDQQRFIKPLCSHGRVLVVTHDDPKKEFQVQAYTITTIGRQVLRLGQFAPQERYLRAVGEELKKAGATVTIADYKDIDENQIQFSNPTPL